MKLCFSVVYLRITVNYHLFQAVKFVDSIGYVFNGKFQVIFSEDTKLNF